MTDPDHWFEPVAEHLGAAYLRYSFTKGTTNEVDFLVTALGLQPGHRVLDVGCGPGRHAHELGRRGIEVHGVDISHRFVDLAGANAPAGVTFERMDARHLTFVGAFDVAISLCQGAFGLAGAGPGAEGSEAEASVSIGDPDGAVLAGMARAVRSGGLIAVSAFSAYFMMRFLEEHDHFDAARGVNREPTTVRSEDGTELDVELWTSCFTPRELRLLARQCGLVAEHVWSVTPGAYAADAPDIDQPEFLLVARRP
jgi:SAM-dependent methyltransferase